MIALIVLYLVGLCESQPPEEQYVLYFDSQIYSVGDECASYLDLSDVVVERFNETISYMTGKMVFHDELGTNNMIEIVLEKENSGNYELFYSHDICNFCSEMESADSAYNKYLKYIGFPEKCPVQVGEYDINDMVVETDDLPINAHNAGKFRATINIYSVGDSCTTDRVLKCCSKLDVLIELDEGR